MSPFLGEAEEKCKIFLSPRDRERVETADEDLLLEWGERFVSARSLRDVLGG